MRFPVTDVSPPVRILGKLDLHLSATDGDTLPDSTSSEEPAQDQDPTSPAIQRTIDGTLLVCLAVLGALVAFGVNGPVRVVLAFVFAMVAPGWVVTGYLGSLSLYPRVIASIGSSIGICIAATSIALWLHRWHPLLIFAILGILVGSALLGRLWSTRARTSDHERGESGVVVE